MTRDRRGSIKVWILFWAVLISREAWAQPASLVTQFGCFAQSGDGGDLLSDGKPAAIIPAGSIPWSSPQPCGLQWIADNAQGLAPDPPPSTVHFIREFELSKDLIAHGTFVLSFKADDKAEFFLNDRSVAVAGCSPPPGNDGECQQYCHEAVIDASKFLPEPQVNKLRVDLTNLFNVPVRDKTGWTSLSYSLCVRSGPQTPPPAPAQKTSSPMDPFKKYRTNYFVLIAAGFFVFQAFFLLFRLFVKKPQNKDW